jgi:hypothetical protein
MKHRSYLVLPFLLAMVLVFAVVPGFSSVTTMGSLDLSPSRGPVGIEVEITGQATSGVTNLDQSCSISSPSNDAIITFSACVINGDGSTSGNFTGSFTVGNVPPGEYTIEVTACAGNNGCAPSKGDFVQSILVVQGNPTIQTPFGQFGVPGSTLQVSGSGFSLNDNSCSLSGEIVGSTVSCRISGGTLTALFVVANVPNGYYQLIATGNTGDSASTNVGA